jgi:hypothetical protein
MSAKDINSDAYKKGWVDGYSDAADDKITIPLDESAQYYYGFDDGSKAYDNEIKVTAIKNNLTPSTSQTFNELIDEL